MKTIIYILGLLLTYSIAFGPQKKETQNKQKAELKLVSDSTEYDLLIFDPGFETFLAKVPHDKEFYGNNYLKNWNLQYVAEWNLRALNPARYGSFYENQIDYQANIDYGLDLNYKLYEYFQYIEEKYGIILLKRK